MREELADMILALGKERSRLCLERLQELCNLDSDILTGEEVLNWHSFSLVEQMDETYQNDDPIRMVSYSEVYSMLRASMPPKFKIVGSGNEGSFIFLILLLCIL